MKELPKSNEVYSLKCFQQKLIDKYKGLINFSDAEGKPNALCFNDWLNSLLNDQWRKGRKANNVDEAERMVIQAAKIILGQVRCTLFDINTHPAHEDISSVELGKAWLPSYLCKFMETLVKKELKQVSLGQALVNAVKPRSSVSAIMFGLGIEVEKVFGSEWLLT